MKHHFIIINHSCYCYCPSVCSESDLKEVVSRLRDWFRVLHENGNHKRVKIQKPEKNSESHGINKVENNISSCIITAVVALTWHTWLRLPSLIFNLFPAEFEVGASPICKDPLGWMFSRLDTNFDLQLDQSEIKSLYLDRNEPCSDAFFRSCDTHADKVISSSEWCTCFQRYTGTVSPCTHMQTQNAFTPEYACKHRCHSASVSVSCESEVLISYNNLVLFSCVIRNYD